MKIPYQSAAKTEVRHEKDLIRDWHIEERAMSVLLM